MRSDRGLPSRVSGAVVGVLTTLACLFAAAIGMALGAGVGRALVGGRPAIDAGALGGAALGALAGAAIMALSARADGWAKAGRVGLVPLLAFAAAAGTALSPLSVGDRALRALAAGVAAALLGGAALIGAPPEDDAP